MGVGGGGVLGGRAARGARHGPEALGREDVEHTDGGS